MPIKFSRLEKVSDMYLTHFLDQSNELLNLFFNSTRQDEYFFYIPAHEFCYPSCGTIICFF